MATPHCDTLIVPFPKYCLGFVYVSSSLRVRVWCALDVTSFVLCFCARDCKKKILVCDSCPLPQKHWSSCCEVELPQISCRWRLHSQTWWCLKTSCYCSTCLIISFYRYQYVLITKVLRIIRLPCLLACLLPADFFISFLPSCLVESLSLLCVISPVYYNPVVSIRGLHLSSIFLKLPTSAESHPLICISASSGFGGVYMANDALLLSHSIWRED